MDSDQYGYDQGRHQDGVRKWVTYTLLGLFCFVELGRVAAAIGAMKWAHSSWADVQGEIASVSTQVVAVVGVVIGFYFGQQSSKSSD